MCSGGAIEEPEIHIISQLFRAWLRGFEATKASAQRTAQSSEQKAKSCEQTSEIINKDYDNNSDNNFSHILLFRARRKRKCRRLAATYVKPNESSRARSQALEASALDSSRFGSHPRNHYHFSIIASEPCIALHCIPLLPSRAPIKHFRASGQASRAVRELRVLVSRASSLKPRLSALSSQLSSRQRDKHQSQ